MNKLIVVVMGQNCEKFLGMCLDSVKGADAIVYCDGGSHDKSILMAVEKGAELIENLWDPEDKAMNGKQRNFYLKYLKEKFPDDWCLALDADEVVEDLSKVKEFIKRMESNTTLGTLSIKMRHFIGDLGHEDATKETHYVPNRLFRINLARKYPEHSHPVLETEGESKATNYITIWHLGHLPIEYMRYIVKRSKQHKEDSIIHERKFLEWWENAHLFGKYPTREINLREIPRIIYNELGLDFEEIYSRQEGIEMKHHLMVKQWNDYFKPKSVLDLGCGRGAYLFYWKWFVPYQGIELNKWAVENAFTDRIFQGDISEEGIHWGYADLITAIDVLEHLSDEQLDRTLYKMKVYGKRFLFSIPFIGNPNLERDSTHKQFKTREEWIKLIESHGIKIKETPKEWLFADQILIGEK